MSAQSQTVTVIAGDGTKGASTPGLAVKSSLDQPAGLAVNRAGDVYVADSGNHQVDEIEPSGGLSIVAGTGTFGKTTPGPATTSDLSDPTGVTVDSAGNVYIADTTEAVVDKVTPDGTLSIVAGIPLSQGYPSTSGGMATSTQIDNPNGVALDSSGNLYISDGAAAMVYKVTPSGTLSIFAGISNGRASGAPTPGPAASTDLHDPLGVTVDPYGNVFIADEFYVEEVTPSGVLSIVAGGGTQPVTTPGPATQADIDYTGGGVATDSAGNLYFTQTVSGDDNTGSVDEVFGVASAPATVDPTATNVSCAESNVADGGGTECTATVTDTASTGYTPPTGTVTFSTSRTRRRSAPRRPARSAQPMPEPRPVQPPSCPTPTRTTP